MNEEIIGEVVVSKERMEEIKKQRSPWLCRWSPTLGDLEGTAEDVWGTTDCEDVSWDDDVENHPAVFFGLYGLPDFYKLWRHKGRKCILWAGTDIQHFLNGYFLDNVGSIRISPAALATWIRKYCESYVENEVERDALRRYGIVATIVPSFLGNVDDFPLSYKPSDKIRLYTSVSGDNFEQYGWDKIPKLATENPSIEFHLYGNTIRPSWSPEDVSLENIIIHGRVSKEQMNAETKEMTGALRLTEFDGFSEILAKSLLWGQWPISIIPYPDTFNISEMRLLKACQMPNDHGRDWFLSVVNKYPWNKNI